MLIYTVYGIGSVFVVLVAWACIETSGWRALTMITAVPVLIAFIMGKSFPCT